jgi:hypothetical protein
MLTTQAFLMSLRGSPMMLLLEAQLICAAVSCSLRHHALQEPARHDVDGFLNHVLDDLRRQLDLGEQAGDLAGQRTHVFLHLRLVEHVDHGRGQQSPGGEEQGVETGLLPKSG